MNRKLLLRLFASPLYQRDPAEAASRYRRVKINQPCTWMKPGREVY